MIRIMVMMVRPNEAWHSVQGKIEYAVMMMMMVVRFPFVIGKCNGCAQHDGDCSDLET